MVDGSTSKVPQLRRTKKIVKLKVEFYATTGEWCKFGDWFVSNQGKMLWTANQAGIYGLNKS